MTILLKNGPIIMRTLSSVSPEQCALLTYNLTFAKSDEERKDIQQRIDSIVGMASPMMMAAHCDFAINPETNQMEMVPFIEDLENFPIQQAENAVRLQRIPDVNHDFMFSGKAGKIFSVTKGLVLKALNNNTPDLVQRETGVTDIGVGTYYHEGMKRYVELWNKDLLQIFQPHKLDS